MTVYIGLSLGHARTSEAEHWLSEQAQPVLTACTHLVREPFPHVALSIEVPDETSTLQPNLAWVAEQHRLGLSGRAFRYPGVELLTGELTVARLLDLSAIERVMVIGGSDAEPETIVDTRNFVRPQWMEGKLTLVATPAAGGRIAPFEMPNPVECCQDHF